MYFPWDLHFMHECRQAITFFTCWLGGAKASATRCAAQASFLSPTMGRTPLQPQQSLHIPNQISINATAKNYYRLQTNGVYMKGRTCRVAR